MKIQTITINGNTFELSDPAVSVLQQTAQQLQNDMTVVKNSIDIIIPQVADSVLTTPQPLPEVRQAQARANIGAMPDKISELKIHEVQIGTDQKELAEVTVSVDGVRSEDGADVRSAIVEFTETHYDGPCVLRNVGEGIRDDDAATVGQVNAAIAASVEPVAQSVQAASEDIGHLKSQMEGCVELTNNFNTDLSDLSTRLQEVENTQGYKKLCERVEVTEADVIAAGEEGITCITVGNDDLNLAPYNDILIKIYVPKAETLNSGKGMLRINITPTDAFSNASANELLFTQSLNYATACGVENTLNSVFAVKALFDNDRFLYGQVMKNGWSSSNGYAGVQNAWTTISTAMKKSEKHYLHITALISAAVGNFKFPAGSYAEVYGR